MPNFTGNAARKLTNDTADFDLSQLFHAQFSPSGQMQRSEAEVSAEEAFIFQQKVRRLAEGYPLQYLLGEWEFYSIPLKIGEGVLIPRPDTETLVDAALELLSGTRAAGHRGLLRRQRRDFVGACPLSAGCRGLCRRTFSTGPPLSVCQYRCNSGRRTGAYHRGGCPRRLLFVRFAAS